MTRQEILDAIQEIMDSNNKQFKGTNEAELHIREDIADFFINELDKERQLSFVEGQNDACKEIAKNYRPL